jgi:hypothetical protein
VHCVIIGFGLDDRPDKFIYEYEDIRGEPHAMPAANINPYLLDAPNVLIAARSRPISKVPEVVYGSFTLDDGNFTIDAATRDQLLAADPRVARYLRVRGWRRVSATRQGGVSGSRTPARRSCVAWPP